MLVFEKIYKQKLKVYLSKLLGKNGGPSDQRFRRRLRVAVVQGTAGMEKKKRQKGLRVVVACGEEEDT